MPTGAAMVERLRRQVVRLNESTLMIDAQLAQATPRSAGTEARRLFDAELALSNCARFASALVTVGVDRAMRVQARDALSAVLAEDWALGGNGDPSAADVLQPGHPSNRPVPPSGRQHRTVRTRPR